MLQPNIIWHQRRPHLWSSTGSSSLINFLLLGLFILLLSGFVENSDDFYNVEPTPALKPNSEGDLTTILLVNNDNNSTNRSPSIHGRYLNVKPVVGVLKSTARTFIQEGVTTEYATQVLGTTLDNGRLYAQLLKKGSRVIYDKDSSIQPSSLTKVTGTGIVSTVKAFNPPRQSLQSHNDLVADQDWQLIDDHLLAKTNNHFNTFVQNTDFIDYPNNALLVYSQKGNLKNVENNGDGGESNNDDTDNFHNESNSRKSMQKNINEVFSISSSSSSSTSSQSNLKISPEKVKPAADLPTFTVKNMFAPSGYSSWDSSANDAQQSEMHRQNKMRNDTEFRSPKFLFRGQKRDEDLHSFSTITYYGFADFTTTVGDTIIVFSPSTSSPNIFPGQITSIKGEATLGQKKSYVSHLPILINQDLIEPTLASYSTTADLHTLSYEISKKQEKIEEEVTEPESQNFPETTPFNENNEATTLQEQLLNEMIKDDEQKELDSSILMSTENELEPSISSSTSTSSQSTDEPTPQSTTATPIVMLTKPSDEDISKIFASLSAAEEAAKKSATEEIQKSSNEQEESKQIITIEPETKIFGGVTTIFFENDPFQQLAEANEAQKVQEQQQSISTSETPTSVNQETTENENIDETTTSTTSTSSSSSSSPSSSSGDEQTSSSSTGTTSASTSSISSTGPTSTEPQLPETTENIETTFEPEEDTTQIQQQQQENENCNHSSTEVVPTLIPKTLTYFTTFFITDENQVTTSVDSNTVTTFDVSYTTKFNCIDTSEILPTTTAAVEISPSNVIEKPIKLESERKSTTVGVTEESIKTTTQSNTEEKNVDKNSQVTTPIIISKEKIFTTTESDTAAEDEDDDEDLDEEESDNDDDHNSGEEIELIYKTLYTTYTYLTTFFHNSTMSVSSRKEILTNVITSTINPTMLRTDLDVSDILSSMTIQPTNVLDEGEISPTTSVGIGRPTTKFVVPQSDLLQIDDILREEKDNDEQRQQQNQLEATQMLGDVPKNGIKTYYTTYTYYTTIFVDGETEVMSRTEVYRNYVTGTDQAISPTATGKAINFSKEPVSEYDNLVFDNVIKPVTSYETLHRSTTTPSTTTENDDNESNGGEVQLSYSTLTRTKDLDSSIKSDVLKDQDSETTGSDNDNVIKMVTDVRSSSSDGDRHIIENVHKQWNGLLEDQISSESNTEDILPSSTLLLQTSYTTFTFYTTMYSGTQTNVISRLETVTNIVTETLQPTQTVVAEEAALPITYFTTFTYWTTLVKDGQITTINHEETVSNVISPTATIQNNLETTAILATSDEINTQNSDLTEAKEVLTSSSSNEKPQENPYTSVIPLSVPMPHETTTTTVESSSVANLNPTTFYTTYTYYTSSYANDETIINSRFETVTNVISPSTTLAENPIKESDVLSSSSSDAGQNNDEENLTPSSSSSSSSNVAASDIVPSITTVGKETNSDYVSLNQGTIIDAEGISTIFYTTKIVPSTIDGKYTELTQSTSSFTVDESKKALQTPTSVDPSSKAYKTGLVRLIEGTNIANKTTTLYQSKVIGTIIDGRYAQIIESTSSFLIEKTIAPTKSIDVASISPTETQSSDTDSLHTVFTPTPALNVIESSINKDKDETEGSSKDENANEEEGEGEVELDENGRPKSRLPFQTKKRIFTPVIRPFASRNRPQFAPKRKLTSASSVQTVTRSDFTPTITATPAIKAESSRGRFNSGRRSSSSILSSSIPAGSSRRFSRPRSSTSSSAQLSTSGPGSRGRLSSSRISPTSAFPSSSTRRGGVVLRGSSAPNRQLSSAYIGNSRNRIRPTSATSLEASPSTSAYTTQETDTEEETVTENSFEGDGNEGEPEANTENTRRNQNPLLRFRRPPLAISPRATTRPVQISTRRNPLTQRAKTTASTTTTTTTQKPRPRAFQRPALPSFQNRPRPQSSLFPPRGLFRQQQVEQELDEETESNDDLHTENADYEDEEGDDGEEEEGDENERKRRHSKGIKKRSKRQADFGSRHFRSRLKRPTTARSVEAEDRLDSTVDDEVPSYRTRPTSRYSNNRTPKSTIPHTPGSRIRPTKPSTTSRPQFTLREKDTVTKSTRSNFRRPTTNGLTASRRTTTVGRPKTSRLKSYINTVTEPPYTSRATSGRTRTTSRGRSTTRSRGRTTDYQIKDSLLPNFDGTITVTHHVPADITIPVVNGKVTEFKHVVTDKVSTEILGPNQYNTLQGLNGESVIVLNREDTSVNGNGATEVTQFVLHKIPTTSIIFTPTTIRGRRTSFSHVIPSTVYDVENIVSTIQPQIAASAPLANILLSQLLLGNIGIPNQNALNPLIGLGAQPGVPGTPTTEYKTRTTSYVTTVTSALSTVIPLTFRGKEILTTIVDSSTSVITATEYITESTVITPTMPAIPQVNSLLLPLLLQQQAQIQQNPILPIQNSVLPQLGDANVKSLLHPDNYHDLDTNRIHKTTFDDTGNSKEIDQEDFNEQQQQQQQQEQQTQPSVTHRKRHRKGHKPSQHINGQVVATAPINTQYQPPSPSLETSVITLYVSGRRPGEFSTVLSTIIGSGSDSSLHKRHADDEYIDKSEIVDYEDFYSAAESDIKEYLLPATNDIISSHILSEGTQSLESIVGDVSKWYENTANNNLITLTEKTTTDSKHLLNQKQTNTQNHDDNGSSKSSKNQLSDQYFLA